MAKMTALELARIAKDVATEYKTLYVSGCFGAPMNERNKKRYSSNNAYNRRITRKLMILNASADVFGFDCVCLIKGILWGWDGDFDKVYGGAVYKSNDVPDIGVDGMINLCETSTDFSSVPIGAMLWVKGHCGIYIGAGLAVEATPKWKNGVQISSVANIGKKTGYPARQWTKWGKLPWVEYESEAIRWAKEKGIITDNTDLNATLTLEQIVKIIHSIFK